MGMMLQGIDRDDRDNMDGGYKAPNDENTLALKIKQAEVIKK